MTQTLTNSRTLTAPNRVGGLKFVIGGGLIIVAIVTLVVSAIQSTGQRFVSVNEMYDRQVPAGENIRLTGAVIGDTITTDPETLEITFWVANVPVDNAEIEAQGGLAAVLDRAAHDPTAQRVQIVYTGPRPDLLQDRAQAIVTGALGGDGRFYADELLLKCPTRYEQHAPVGS